MVVPLSTQLSTLTPANTKDAIYTTKRLGTQYSCTQDYSTNPQNLVLTPMTLYLSLRHRLFGFRAEVIAEPSLNSCLDGLS